MTLEAQVGAGDPTAAPAVSTAFRGYVASLDRREVTLAEIVTALGERSLPVALIIFALPNCLPSPPGIGSLFALPLLAVCWQMMRGYPVLRLPAALGRRRIPFRTLRWMADKGLRPLVAVERRCRPRLPALVGARAERWLGLWMILVTLVVMLPGPMTNFLPSFGLMIIAAGLLQRDGVAVLVGLVWSLLASIIAVTVAAALLGGIWLGLRELFA